jgi:hypothetical protein
MARLQFVCLIRPGKPINARTASVGTNKPGMTEDVIPTDGSIRKVVDQRCTDEHRDIAALKLVIPSNECFEQPADVPSNPYDRNARPRIASLPIGLSEPGCGPEVAIQTACGDLEVVPREVGWDPCARH